MTWSSDDSGNWVSGIRIFNVPWLSMFCQFLWWRLQIFLVAGLELDKQLGNILSQGFEPVPGFEDSLAVTFQPHLKKTRFVKTSF